MDQEIQEIRAELKKVTRLTEENTASLRRIENRYRWALVWSFFRWAIFIGLTIGAFYYVQPYLEQIVSVYQKVTGNKLDFMQFFNKF